ncbi:hypothetical protein PsYK624_068010 [Phanerochaete sordida]|uniref:Uncharacterized protein n=1 Tax=Phanerochaete sordida TaxID=48140 RepID=A0A9P3LE66_9APHY|nr:hypothetical protein PsYK624_068010 [Phanerochaete sordida]
MRRSGLKQVLSARRPQHASRAVSGCRRHGCRVRDTRTCTQFHHLLNSGNSSRPAFTDYRQCASAFISPGKVSASGSSNSTQKLCT